MRKQDEEKDGNDNDIISEEEMPEFPGKHDFFSISYIRFYCCIVGFNVVYIRFYRRIVGFVVVCTRFYCRIVGFVIVYTIILSYSAVFSV